MHLEVEVVKYREFLIPSKVIPKTQHKPCRYKIELRPLASSFAAPTVGAWTGNRGVIHNENKEIVRPYAAKAWITCALACKGAHRVVMSPNRWTELFFLDEVTAFAAGHRPCAYCRRTPFNAFKSLWLAANQGFYDLPDQKMTTIDAIIHAERMDKDGQKKTHSDSLFSLPDGVFICFNNELSQPLLRHKNHLFEWHEPGYLGKINLPEADIEVAVLTPKSIVRVFRKNYDFQVDRSIVG